ncbi:MULTISPECIES: PhoD-like phosphatase [Trichocoleus]|uniref:PhoD-like phosphatase n=1 Tax=Trichocoleus desertorum GB2-A4 TaxID=2933944 RepID=A0ABV0J143_9CYAN|nr:PhoD-like phosphatase [Trichocoleus sp. FACHB-46]MBD1860110.1 PhoD-like phosphatase [Trichocoleus sp. FACHB-46]
MKDQAWDEFLSELPLILAGPILQHTDSESVTVWLALRQPCQVALKIYETTDQGEVLSDCLLEGSRSTVALGKFLHVLAVTAHATKQQLTSDRIYAYDLRFETLEPTPISYTLLQALCADNFPTVSISYFTHEKPTFALSPARLQDLRIAQGSCRKPHGNGFDALPLLDCLIEETANQPRHRPHQLFLTGDQIYGDDVADPLLWVASHLGDALLGWKEKLPIGRREPNDVVYRTPDELPAGQRAEVATTQAGFTAGLRNQRAKTTSHLLSLGEYYASYILAWSPVCWPNPIPLGKEMPCDRKAIRAWDREARDMRQFIHTLWKVRRALANVPMYTIFDDHDVSDDWNLNQAWCLRVLGRPLGRRAVQNSLLAYAVFQAWGNTPEQFAAGSSGEKLLAAAQAWSASEGTDKTAYEAIARHVGMPSPDSLTGLPTFVSDGPVLVLERHPEAITWHYTVRSACHEVLVLDTRTWRGYPADEKAIAPPMLLCPQAFKRQLTLPLQNTDSLQATFIIAPTNVFGMKVIDWIHQWQLSKNKVFATDVGDAWNVNTEALAQLLTTLFEQRQQVIVMSGDIHYSSVVRLSHQSNPPSTAPASVLVQLTCSALKNEETITRLIHTRLKDWLLPEKTRYWMGWSNSPDMVELSTKQLPRLRRGAFSLTEKRSGRAIASLKKDNLSSTPPDWTCALEWVPRDQTRISPFGAEVPWLLPPWRRARNIRHRWLQPLLLWRYRWFQDGREVVGLNNLAVIQFEPTASSGAYAIAQYLYWFSPWQPTQIVYSSFVSSVAPNQTLLAKMQPPHHPINHLD